MHECGSRKNITIFNVIFIDFQWRAMIARAIHKNHACITNQHDHYPNLESHNCLFNHECPKFYCCVCECALFEKHGTLNVFLCARSCVCLSAPMMPKKAFHHRPPTMEGVNFLICSRCNLRRSALYKFSMCSRFKACCWTCIGASCSIRAKWIKSFMVRLSLSLAAQKYKSIALCL
jgi:hypothetical protein